MQSLLALYFVINLGGTLYLVEPSELTIEQLLASVARDDFAERESALDRLAAQRASTEEHLPRLRERLHDEDPLVRQHAALALAVLGVDKQPVIDELLAGMGRRCRATYLSQPERARSSMAALVRLGPKAVPALIKAMSDEKYASRDLALEALGKIGPAANDALPAIRKWLNTDDVFLLCQLVEAKWRIDGDATFAIDRMVALLDGKHRRQTYPVVRVLVAMGGDAKRAVPTLVDALQLHRDHNVLWAIGELAPHARDVALPALREAMSQSDLADDAAITLQNLGEPAENLIPLQLSRLQKCKPKDGGEPMQIAYTIVIHGPAAKPYLGEMIALLKHQNPEVRRAATWAVPRMFGEDMPVIATLEKALNDPETAEEAAKSLKMLEEARR